MIKIRGITVKKIILGGLVSGMILFLACDSGSCTESGFFEDFRDVTGVDLTQPANVARVALTGDTVGNETQNEALDTASRNVAQLVYTKFGDDHEAKQQWYLAADDYQLAIYQTRTDTDSGKQKVQELHVKMAEDYVREAGGYLIKIDEGTLSTDKHEIYDGAAIFYGKAAPEYRKAAEIAQDRLELSTAEKYLVLANRADYLSKENRRLADLYDV